MQCFIVRNEEEDENLEFEDITIARRTLVSLVESGIRCSFVIEQEYHSIKFN